MSEQTAFDRFEDKVSDDSGNGCRQWIASTGGGYGQFRYEGKTMTAHRVAWLLYVGKIPDGQVVRHKCDKPLCVNIAHLELGTQADNIRDSVARGTHRTPPTGRGEDCSACKLTWAKVFEIRQRRENGETLKAIADRFWVTESNVWKIVHGRSW